MKEEIPVLPTETKLPCKSCGTPSVTAYCDLPVCRDMQSLLASPANDLSKYVLGKTKEWMLRAAELAKQGHASNFHAVKEALVQELEYLLHPARRPHQITTGDPTLKRCFKCRKELPPTATVMVCSDCIRTKKEPPAIPPRTCECKKVFQPHHHAQVLCKSCQAMSTTLRREVMAGLKPHPDEKAMATCICGKKFLPAHNARHKVWCPECKNNLTQFQRQELRKNANLEPKSCPCGNTFNPTAPTQVWCQGCAKLTDTEKRALLKNPVKSELPERTCPCKKKFVPTLPRQEWCDDCRKMTSVQRQAHAFRLRGLISDPVITNHPRRTTPRSTGDGVNTKTCPCGKSFTAPVDSPRVWCSDCLNLSQYQREKNAGVGKFKGRPKPTNEFVGHDAQPAGTAPESAPPPAKVTKPRKRPEYQRKTPRPKEMIRALCRCGKPTAGRYNSTWCEDCKKLPMYARRLAVGLPGLQYKPRICTKCKESFVPINGTQTLCVTCAGKAAPTTKPAKLEPKVKACACGATFKISNRDDRQKWCKPCQKKTWRQRMEIARLNGHHVKDSVASVRCERCQENFYPAHKETKLCPTCKQHRRMICGCGAEFTPYVTHSKHCDVCRTASPAVRLERVRTRAGRHLRLLLRYRHL